MSTHSKPRTVFSHRNKDLATVLDLPAKIG
eukprot:COSAG06_NODE_51817_length_309_cov_1.600000_1_plen_29_part_10